MNTVTHWPNVGPSGTSPETPEAPRGPSDALVRLERSLPPEWRGGASRPSADHTPLDALHGPGVQDVVSPMGVHAGLARALGVGPIVWVEEAGVRREHGGPYGRGISSSLDPSCIILVRVRRAVDALWAMEEALRAGLPVMGEIDGSPRALDFTATRRLEMRARAANVGCLLVRTGPRTGGGSSGAHWRWRVLPHRSAPDPYDAKAPGRPRWVLELTRARSRPPGAWVVEPCDDGVDSSDETGSEIRAPHRLRVVAPLADGGVAPGRDEAPGGGTGTVVPLRPGRAA